MKAAYWNERTHLIDDDEYICSACGYRSHEPYKVCPNCGRNMKKIKYDPSWVDEAEGMSALMEGRVEFTNAFQGLNCDAQKTYIIFFVVVLCYSYICAHFVCGSE